jgi:hypothetical protein
VGKAMAILGLIGRLLLGALGLAMTAGGALGLVSWATGWTFRTKGAGGVTLPGDAPGFSLLLLLAGLAVLALFRWIDRRSPG